MRTTLFRTMLLMMVVVICLALVLLAVLARQRRSAIKLTRTRTTIPKKIMMTWKTALNASSPAGFLRNFETAKRLHPDWQVVFLDDEGVEKFMKSAAAVFKEAYRRCDLRIQQIDVFRMAYIYAEGGFYLDCDVALSKPLDELLNNGAVFPQELAKNTDEILQKRGCSYLLGNYAFGAVPNHSFFIDYAQNCVGMLEKLKIKPGEPNNKRRVFYTTGPVALTVSYLDWLRNSNDSDNLQPNLQPIRILRGAGDARFGDFGTHQLTGTWKNKPLSSGRSSLK